MPSFDFETRTPCSVVLSYVTPFGNIQSYVFNDVSPSALRQIKTIIEYDKRKS